MTAFTEIFETLDKNFKPLQVGDKVVVSESLLPKRSRNVGVIFLIESSAPFPYYVGFNDTSYQQFDEDGLLLVDWE